MRTVIVDDEPLARRGVRVRLSRESDFNVLRECGTGREAIVAIKELTPDLVFLDVQMPDLTGFEVLRSLQGDKLPGIIFLTAYDQYAIDAFEVHALDYLLKPIDDERFRKALDFARFHMKNSGATATESGLRKVLDMLEKGQQQMHFKTHFAVKTGRRIHVVPIQEIDWIEASGDYLTLHAGGKRHLIRETMGNVERELDPQRFLRIHRSTIVQASRIRELLSLGNCEFLVRLADGSEIRASRSYSHSIERWL